MEQCVASCAPCFGEEAAAAEDRRAKPSSCGRAVREKVCTGLSFGVCAGELGFLKRRFPKKQGSLSKHR